MNRNLRTCIAPVTFAALIAVCWISPSAWADQFDSLILDLGKDNTPAQFEAVNTLLASAQAAHPKIVAGLSNANPVTRKACASLLRQIRDAKDFLILAQSAENDADWLVREQAIQAIGDLGMAESVTTLSVIASADSMVNNRITAVRYLAHIAGAGARPALRKIFHDDKNAAVRLNAARELARYGDISGYETAKTSLNDSDWTVKYAAVGLLGYAGKQVDIALLESIASDSEEMGLVRNESRSAAQHIKLVQLSDADQLNLLNQSLEDKDRVTREWAAKELFARRDDKAVAVLKRIAAASGHPGQREAGMALQGIKK